MADSRTYILDRDTGVAARFYSRSGLSYGLATESIQQLLEHSSKNSGIADDFVIIEGDRYFARIDGTLLFRYIPGVPDKYAPDWRDEKLADQEKELVKLRGRVFTLTKRCEKAGVSLE